MEQTMSIRGCYRQGEYAGKSRLPQPLWRLNSRWREIRACNGNACGASKGQNFHDSLLDLRFLIVATDPKAPIY
jgi:hypothetical protein